MRKIALSISLIFFIAAITFAQKKELSYEQSFKAATSDIVRPLPVIREWIDDEHYTESKKDADGKTKLWSVDVKTGNAVIYKDDVIESPRIGTTNSSDENKNMTASPDGKWAAYTRKNNLYAKDLGSGKEIQLSKDGSDNIYSGYAAWVYYEE
ncbi:MAG TPA: DPP IV N-terminal domain-containing protein, partial [Puia sp.]